MRNAAWPAIALLCGLIALGLPLAAQGSASWYASDGAGIRYGAIANESESPWAIRVERLSGSERSSLYKDGKLIRAWSRSYGAEGILTREAVEEGGSIREERLYDDAGRPSVERIFSEEGSVEETSYTYGGGRLIAASTAKDGSVVRAISYVYAPDGRLATAKESSGRSFGTSGPRSGASSSWRQGPEGTELRTHDASGRLVAITVYQGADMVSREERFWNDGILDHSVIALPDGTSITTSYIASGKAAGEISSAITALGAETLSSEQRTYDDEGLVASIRTEAKGVVTATEYEYADGKLSVERRLRAQALVARIAYESATTRVEESYDGGAAFARVYFVDGRKVKEEILKDGEIVRTRIFP